MIAFKRILYPTDFSKSGTHALITACEMARKFDAELHLLNVLHDVAAISAYGIAEAWLPVEWRQEVRAQAAKLLQELPGDGRGEGLTIKRVIAEGVPYYEIVDYADKNHVDLIVMGTHGRSGLPHMLLGSVAERVVREAPCAVMTIRPGDA